MSFNSTFLFFLSAQQKQQLETHCGKEALWAGEINSNFGKDSSLKISSPWLIFSVWNRGNAASVQTSRAVQHFLP